MDKDGDGKRNKADVYGFAGMWDANGSAMLQAADIYVATRNEDGMFELSLESTRLTDFYDKLFTWSKDESTYIWDYGNKANTDKIAPFLDELAALKPRRRCLNPIAGIDEARANVVY